MSAVFSGPLQGYVPQAQHEASGLCEVWSALNDSSQPVLVKVYSRPSTPDWLSRVVFEQEAWLLEQLGLCGLLRNKQFPKILLRGQNALGHNFIVLDWFPGTTVPRDIPGQGLPLADGVKLLNAAARPLVQLHDNGIIHRDVKFANLLCDQFPNWSKLRWIDLGVARRIGDVPEWESLGTTISYGHSPPERHGAFGGVAVEGPASDTFSLFSAFARLTLDAYPCHLWHQTLLDHWQEALSMHEQFRGREADLMREEIERTRQIFGRLPEGLRLVLERAFAPNPSDRYQSLSLAIDAVNQSLATQSGDSPSSNTDARDSIFRDEDTWL